MANISKINVGGVTYKVGADIDTSSYVTKTGAETISGAKTFTAQTRFDVLPNYKNINLATVNDVTDLAARIDNLTTRVEAIEAKLNGALDAGTL